MDDRPTIATRVGIRPERAEDHRAIHDVTKRAFAAMSYAAGDEQELINALRQAGALALSLVAVDGGTVVGHVAFSPAGAPDGSLGWFALGPVAVEPTSQGQGIGRQLIAEGLRLLAVRKAAGCILVGNPAY